MRLAHAAARKIAAEALSPNGEGKMKLPRLSLHLSPVVLGDSFPQNGSWLTKVDRELISLVFSEAGGHAGAS
jgi:hypothetical protein